MGRPHLLIKAKTVRTDNKNYMLLRNTFNVRRQIESKGWNLKKKQHKVTPPQKKTP